LAVSRDFPTIICLYFLFDFTLITKNKKKRYSRTYKKINLRSTNDKIKTDSVQSSSNKCKKYLLKSTYRTSLFKYYLEHLTVSDFSK